MKKHTWWWCWGEGNYNFLEIIIGMLQKRYVARSGISEAHYRLKCVMGNLRKG